MESFSDQARALALAVVIHLALIVVIWFSALWALPQNDDAAAGEPIRATLQVSKADIRRAKAAIKAMRRSRPRPRKRQPRRRPSRSPSRKPQTSDIPVQMTPQAPQDRPDTVDQERISRLAQEQADELALEEQEERRRQEQVELTEDLKRQQEVERQQRLREQYEAVTARARGGDQAHPSWKSSACSNWPTRRRRPRRAGAAGEQCATAGQSRHRHRACWPATKPLMTQNADDNWNRTGAPELTHCQVRFTQIPGGEVIDIDFLNCPYDEQGRDSVERALRKNPMPYSGFEKVFLRQWALDFCYPREECER